MQSRHDTSARSTRDVRDPGRDPGRDPDRGSNAWVWVVGLLVLVALVIAAFFLLGGDADVDTEPGSVDIEMPQTDVDVNAPDVNVESPDITMPEVNIEGGEFEPGGLEVNPAPEAEADAGNP
jgi:hypothetical protein